MSVSDDECVDRVRAALNQLYDASEPYVENAAPHEQLFSGEDLRNLERLRAARAEALCALGDS